MRRQGLIALVFGLRLGSGSRGLTFSGGWSEGFGFRVQVLSSRVSGSGITPGVWGLDSRVQDLGLGF